MTLPLENLDNKTYRDLVSDALSRIPLYSPDWTDRNASDPGITFIELLAWLAEIQIFRLNRISDRSYLKFLRLLGDSGPEPARSAKVKLTFSLKGNETVEIPRGTGVCHYDADLGQEIIFETQTREDIILEPEKMVTVMVDADEGLTFRDLKFSSTGLPNQSIRLPKAPVVVIEKVEVNEEDRIEEWTRVPDLDASRPEDMHYVLDAEKGVINFGDGIRGRIPPVGNNSICVTYRSGGGTRGNLPPGSINIVLGDLAGKVSVVNQEASSGGKDAETLKDAIRRVRIGLKMITRAVTSSDYEYLALQIPGTKRAKAMPLYHPAHPQGAARIVSVIIVPDTQEDQPKPSDDLIRKVYYQLYRYRLLTTEIFVLPPEYITVTVKATVAKKKQFKTDSVKQSADERLKEFLDPFEGGPDGEGWPFGRPVYISEIYQILAGLENLAGQKIIDYVKDISLSWRREEGSKMVEGNTSEDLEISSCALVISGGHDITVVDS